MSTFITVKFQKPVSLDLPTCPGYLSPAAVRNELDKMFAKDRM